MAHSDFFVYKEASSSMEGGEVKNGNNVEI